MTYAKFWNWNNDPDSCISWTDGFYSLHVETNNKQLIIHFKCDKHCDAEQGTTDMRFDLVGPQRMTPWE